MAAFVPHQAAHEARSVGYLAGTAHASHRGAPVTLAD